MADYYRHSRQYPSSGDGAPGDLPGKGKGPSYGMPALNARAQAEKAIDLLYRQKWVVLVCFLLVLGGTGVYLYLQEPVYQASSMVTVNLSYGRPGTSSAGQTGTSAENPFAQNTRSLTGELFILQTSQQFQQRVQERLAEIAERTGERPQGFVTYEYVRGSDNAISMMAQSTDPRDAALLANLYATEYVDLTKEASRTYLTESREMLEELEARRKSELRQAEERVNAHVRDNAAVGLDQEVSRVMTQISSLESQLDNARIDLQMREASRDALERELELINPQVARRIASTVDRRIDELQTEKASLEMERERILLANPNLRGTPQATEQLKPYDQQIAQLEQQINDLSQQLVDEVSGAGGVLQGEQGLTQVTNLRQQIVAENIAISGIQARIDVMQDRLAEYRSEVVTIPGQSTALANLERERQYALNAYENVLARLQQTRLEENSEPGYAQLLRRAGVPRLPVSREIPRNLFLGGFIGLLAGLGLGVVRDKLDSRLYKPDALKEMGLTVLGVIPNMQPLIKEDHGGKEMVEQDGHRYQTSLLSLINPMSAIAEAYRQLRTNIHLGLPGTNVQVLLVTSASVEEGKSTTAANLAVTMAQAGRRTLLIDADLRRPRMHEIMGLKRDPGLVQMLLSAEGLSLERFKTPIDNVYALPAGGLVVNPAELPGLQAIRDVQAGEDSIVLNPAELLGSPQLRELLAAFRAQFDVIIVDSPPVLAATDAALLSTECDATLLVTRAGTTREGELEYALESLESVGARVIGTLFNGFDVSMAYGYKYRFRSYSKYGHYSKYGYYAYKRAS